MKQFFSPMIVPSATTGVASSYSTSGFFIGFTQNYAIQAVYTGGLNGNLSLKSSNDNINFDTIAGSTSAITTNLTGTTGHFTWNAPNVGYQYVQASFDNTGASSGSLQFNIFSKGYF